MNETVEKWKTTRLLDGFEGYDAVALADNLDDFVSFIIELPDSKNREKMADFLLPIIVILFRDKNVRMINPKKLYEDFSNFYKTNWHPEMLDEGDFCKMYVEQFDAPMYE